MSSFYILPWTLQFRFCCFSLLDLFFVAQSLDLIWVGFEIRSKGRNIFSSDNIYFFSHLVFYEISRIGNKKILKQMPWILFVSVAKFFWMRSRIKFKYRKISSKLSNGLMHAKKIWFLISIYAMKTFLYIFILYNYSSIKRMIRHGPQSPASKVFTWIQM